MMNYPQYETLHYHSWSERQERTPEDNICYHGNISEKATRTSINLNCLLAQFVKQQCGIELVVERP